MIDAEAARLALSTAGWAMLHVMWQAPVVLLIHRACARGLHLGPRGRQRLGLAGMVLIVGLAVGTAASAALLRPVAPAPIVTSASVDSDDVGIQALGAGHIHALDVAAVETSVVTAGDRLRTVLAALGAAWLVVVLVSLSAIVGGRVLLGRLGKQARTLPDALEPRFVRLLAGLNLEPRVRVRYGARIDLPVLVGVRRPLILLPDWLLSELPTDYVEAIMAHELAHVRRADYVVNLGQLVIEALLMRHPAVTALSRTIRRDRELCCDALAADVLGSPRLLAEALARLDHVRARPWGIVPAASEGDLVERIRVLLGAGRQAPRPVSDRLTAGAGALLLTLVLAAPLALGSPLPERPAHLGAARPLVLGGTDPVALLSGTELPGRADLERDYDGFRYRFASIANARLFDQTPQRYAVVNVSFCPITGKAVRPDVFEVVDGRIHLFCCAEARHIPQAQLRALVRGEMVLARFGNVRVMIAGPR